MREVESEEIAAEGVQSREKAAAYDNVREQAMEGRTNEDSAAEEEAHGWEEGGGNGLGGRDRDHNSLDD